MTTAPAAHPTSPPHAAGRPTPPPHPADHQAPVTPGKVAMWLFLATEVMFFTGLIGSYIVMRVGSPPQAYSNFFPPGTPLRGLLETKGVRLVNDGGATERIVGIVEKAAGVSEEEAHRRVTHGAGLVLQGVAESKAVTLRDQIDAVGGKAELEDLKVYNWPLPYDAETNPLSIDLTAANTFVLICSSVTMVLALAAVQRGDRKMLSVYLAATVLIGALFLGVQIFEYYSLMKSHHYPAGVSTSSHFTPDVSLFASCFFTMTGFHGAHVAGGVVMLTCIFIGSLLGRFTRERHAAVELVGLYWHFVDLVWIILFTVVYLV